MAGGKHDRSDGKGVMAIMMIRSDKTTAQLMDGALMERFLLFQNVRPGSAAAYRYNVRAFGEYLSGHGVRRPRQEHALAYRNALVESGKKPSTIRTYLVALRLFFRWTEREGLCRNIMDQVRFTGREAGHCRDALTAQQVRKILRKIDRSTLTGVRNYAILLLMVVCGLRCIEVSRAKLGDFVRRGKNTVLYIHGKGRDGSVEFVKLPRTVRRSIYDYLRERGPEGRDAPLFASVGPRGAGRHLSTRSISRIVKTALLNAGYDSERLCAHSLRHTAVTLALKGGEKLEAVKGFARHGSVETTLIYSHAIERENCTCSQTIERMIFGRQGHKKPRKTRKNSAKA